MLGAFCDGAADLAGDDEVIVGEVVEFIVVEEVLIGVAVEFVVVGGAVEIIVDVVIGVVMDDEFIVVVVNRDDKEGVTLEIVTGVEWVFMADEDERTFDKIGEEFICVDVD